MGRQIFAPKYFLQWSHMWIIALLNRYDGGDLVDRFAVGNFVPGRLDFDSLVNRRFIAG
jgi:hypothetical protein